MTALGMDRKMPYRNNLYETEGKNNSKTWNLEQISWGKIMEIVAFTNEISLKIIFITNIIFSEIRNLSLSYVISSVCPVYYYPRIIFL